MGAVINETERRGGVGYAAASYSEDREFISGFGDRLSRGLPWVSPELPCTYRDSTLNYATAAFSYILSNSLYNEAGME